MHGVYPYHVIFIYSVFYLAGEFAKHLQRQLMFDFPTKHETLFTNEEVVCAQIAGLCHDLGKESNMAVNTCMHVVSVVIICRTWPFITHV